MKISILLILSIIIKMTHKGSPFIEIYFCRVYVSDEFICNLFTIAMNDCIIDWMIDWCIERHLAKMLFHESIN